MNIRLPAPLDYFNRENEAQTRAAIEQAFAALGVQGLTFFDELETGSLDVTGDAAVAGAIAVTGAATVGGELTVGTTVTTKYWKNRVSCDNSVFTTVDPAILIGLVMVRDATNGGSALIHIDVNASSAITIISQPAGAASTFVTAAPGATQIQLQMSGNDLQAKGGSSRASFLVDIVHFGEMAS